MRLVLASAIWFSAVAFYPVSIAAQTQTDKTNPDKKKKEKNRKRTEAAKTPQTQTDKNSPLSEKEDPSKIGTRNINGGTDKFTGWLGGSKEKEIALGRQLALEVEQQSKLVDDPMVTEYINRVGQNIVLHSDAKVPFTIKVIDSDEVNALRFRADIFTSIKD